MALELSWAAIAALFVALTLARAVLGSRFVSAFRATASGACEDEAKVSVLQPILGGDPTLEQNLRENLQAHPRARFVWLVDGWDDAGRAAAAAALETPGVDPARVRVEVCPDVQDGMNPKVTKLAVGARLCQTDFLAVLDDDTVLRPGALSQAVSACVPGALVTGLPCYVHRESFWSAQLAAFVNANVLLTYPAVASVFSPRTLNGMFYVLRRQELEAKGGFDAIVGELCDDYAIASLFRRSGGHVVQSAIVHPIRTHVTGARHYFSVMRRWMIFAHRFVRENAFVPVLAFAVVPAALPLVMVALGAAAGLAPLGLSLGLLLGKAALLEPLRRRFLGLSSPLSALVYEVAADLLVPLHSTLALVRPNRFAWRKRRIALSADTIHYE